MDFAQAIKKEAFRLGFSLAGVTTSDPLPHAQVFEGWLKQGRQAEMHYLETPRSRLVRAYPERLLPGCHSILVLGVQYPAPLPVEHVGKAERIASGRTAAYAWGVDYHEFLPERLRSLVTFIEGAAGHPILNRWYTDTGPILERELAQRAGLGWIGKNTCLIIPHQGSFFLLAEILLGLELEPDPPFTQDLCGKCTRCLDACPTACILPDHTLDAGRCISYLTIELKGSIPRHLRSAMGSWVFGCDICQQVCPWNRFAGAGADPVFNQPILPAAPDLVEELGLTAQEFNRMYRNSPLRRPKRGGYLRNIAVALGNLQIPATSSALARSLHSDSDPLVRAHAAWALGQFTSAVATQALQDALHTENDPQVLAEIENVLANVN